MTTDDPRMVPPVVGVNGGILVHVKRVTIVNGLRGSYSLHEYPDGHLDGCDCVDAHGRPYQVARFRPEHVAPIADLEDDPWLSRPCPKKHLARYRDAYGRLGCRQCDRDKAKRLREKAA